MKYKVICIMLCLFAGTCCSYAIDLQGCYKESFKITGYYSPKRGQDFYAKGNFEDEKVLNGDGIHGASGKPVFNGMIAAPKMYDFGTKIYLPGFGVGSVEDRGGAIVERGVRGEQYHRIDIWMGKGEEGLQRAISFGVVYKQGRVCPKTSPLKVGFDMSQFPIMKNFFQATLWRVQLWKGRNDPRVGVLQGYLKKLGYFTTEVNNVFGETTQHALCDFQHSILGVKKSDFWCGYFSNATRSGLKAYLEKKGLLGSKLEIAPSSTKFQEIQYDNGPKPIVDEVIIIKKQEIGDKRSEKKVDSNQKSQQSTPSSLPIVKNRQEIMNEYYLNAGDSKKYQFLSDIPFGTKSMEVKLLQRKLQWMGYYKKQISGVYDETTKAAIFQFQIDRKILKYDDTSVSKGWLGVKTRELLNQVK